MQEPETPYQRPENRGEHRSSPTCRFLAVRVLDTNMFSEDDVFCMFEMQIAGGDPGFGWWLLMDVSLIGSDTVARP
jgi:hypothetical protein